MSDRDAAAPSPNDFGDVGRRSQEAGIADESAAYMAQDGAEGAEQAEHRPGSTGADWDGSSDLKAMSDADVIALAAAEREAGVPDLQTAKAAAAAQRRIEDERAPECHPS